MTADDVNALSAQRDELVRHRDAHRHSIGDARMEAAMATVFAGTVVMIVSALVGVILNSRLGFKGSVIGFALALAVVGFAGCGLVWRWALARAKVSIEQQRAVVDDFDRRIAALDERIAAGQA